MKGGCEGIESFVKKLHKEGVAAGEKEKEEIVTAARDEATTLVANAKSEAAKIVSDARKEAEAIISRAKSELGLAARDSVCALKQRVEALLSTIVRSSVEERLRDAGFVQHLIHEVVTQYAHMDGEGATQIKVSLNDDLLRNLHEGALAGVNAQIRGGCREAGFEYTYQNGTVEVSTSSVAEVLTSLVGPELLRLLESAVAEEKGGEV